MKSGTALLRKPAEILGRVRRDRYVYLALLPGFALIAVFLVYPAVQAFLTSLKEWDLANYMHPQYIGILNYQDLLRDRQFWRSFVILFYFIAWGLLVPQSVVIAASYLVYRLGGSRVAGFFKTIFVIPMVIPTMVLTLFWLFFYEPNLGMLNTILAKIGLSSWKHVWLWDSGRTALWSLFFVGFPWVSGLGFLVFLAGFQGISEELHDASQIDGARTLRIFFKIDLPLIIPQIKLMVVLGLIWTMPSFQGQYILTKGGPGYATTVPGLHLFNKAFVYGSYGYGAAMGVVLFVVIMAVTLINLKFIQRKD